MASYSKGVLLMEAAGFSKATITEDGKQVEVFQLDKGISVVALKGIRLDLQCAYKASQQE